MSSTFVFRVLLACLVGAWIAPAAGAQTFGSQREILVPPEGGSTGAFALTTDIDGTTAVVGSPDESEGPSSLLAGAVYVFVRDATGAWTLQQRIAGGTADRHFGSSVALSGDTLAVGSIPTNGNSSASVRVFARTGTGWTLQQEVGLHRAQSLRLKGDTLVVGDSSVNSAQGAVTIYERAATTWGAGTLLTVPGGALNNAQFGASVDLSGSTLCVGVPKDTANGIATAGSVRIFTRTASGSWTQQQKIDGSVANSFFGSSCSVDGDTVAIGALNVDNGAGFVYVRSGATWSQQQKLSISQISGNVAGQYIRLVGDVAVVAGVHTLTVFGRSGTAWIQRQSIPRPSQQFSAIGLTPSYLIVGTNPAGPAHGTAYVYAVEATGAPGAPTNFQASVDGSVVNLSWGAPTTGAAPTSYTLRARTAGGVLIREVPQGTATSFSSPAPNGSYTVSVFASNTFGAGPETAQLPLVVPLLPVPPGTPRNLAATISGSTVGFSWAAPASGGAVGGYTLLAGTSPGFTDTVAVLPVAPSLLGTTVPGVPAGTYFVRLVAQNAGGISSASNEISVTVGGGNPPPGPPTLNPPVVSGSTVSLSWAPGSGGAPTSYVLIARLPNGSTIGPVPLTETTVTYAGVPRGTYAVTVVAINAAGVGLPSNVTVVVP